MSGRELGITDYEAVLCEDDHSMVLVIVYTADEDVAYVQDFTLPIAIEPTFFLADEWIAAARPGEWRYLYG